MRKIVLIAAVVGLLLAVLPAATVFAAPPVQQGIAGKVVALFVQLYEDAQLEAAIPQGQLWMNDQVQISTSAGGARYVRCPATGVEGWVGEAAIGTSIVLLSGAYLPPELTVGAAPGMRSLSDCQKWRECNGYSRAGSGRVWGWLDRSGVLTTHTEDCAPYIGKPAPPGCTP